MNTAADLTRNDTVRARLTARREELRARLERVSADQRRAAEPVSADAPDRISQTENDTVIETIGRTAHEELIQVDEALWRLDTGHYGRCESCGHPIEAARLEAVPYAKRCAGCSSQPDRPMNS
jgi:RNA polymerase-binding transcription factor DksA